MCSVLYLNEQKVSTVQQAAVLADEYALIHKSVFVKCPSDFMGYTSQRENEVNSSDFKIRLYPSSPKTRKECGYCHKVGHFIAECRILKRKQERQDFSTQPRGSVLVKVVSQQSMTSVVPDECFQPFVFEGYVSLTGIVLVLRIRRL